MSTSRGDTYPKSGKITRGVWFFVSHQNFSERENSPQKMKAKFQLGITISVILSLISFGAVGKPAITGVDIPQLLGVWYGEYSVSTDGKDNRAEMWMEVSYQLHENGYHIRGYNRWNIPTDKEDGLVGAKSKGESAEHFDTFAGTIAKNGKTVSFVEDRRKSTIAADLIDSETMRIALTPHGKTEAAFTTTLKRIDTKYAPTDINVLGIDVSHHSGNVDWQRVKDAGYRFAYVKATEGVDNPDAMFASHWQQLQKINLPRGAYHFYVTEDDPEQQARFFISHLQADPGTLPPVVDVEVLGKNTHGDMSANLLRFLRLVEKELGVKPMIYTSPQFWDKFYQPEFADYYLWLSEYGVKMPKVPFGWKNWSFWQYSIDQAVDGVDKTADISMIHPKLSVKNFPQTKTQLK